MGSQRPFAAVNAGSLEYWWEGKSWPNQARVSAGQDSMLSLLDLLQRRPLQVMPQPCIPSSKSAYTGTAL